MNNNKQKEIESAINTRKFKYAGLRTQLNEEGIRHRYLLRAKKLKNVRNSITISLVSIFICIASLSLTTYAWFTDAVSNTNNRIQAGTLKVGLFTEDKNGAVVDLADAGTALFSASDLTPTDTIEMKIVVKNQGDLAIKYKLYFNVTPSNVDDLSKNLNVYIKTAEAEGYPDEPRGTISELSEITPLVSDTLGTSTGNKEDVYFVKLELKEEAPQNSSTSFDIRVQATQYTAEEDGFSNNGYDATVCYEGYTLNGGYCVLNEDPGPEPEPEP